jgi:hypothetical protein
MFEILFIVTLVFGTGSAVTMSTVEKECLEKVKVLEVGTCDYSATCSVILSNGKMKNLKYPIKGEEVCYKEMKTYFWDAQKEK